MLAKLKDDDLKRVERLGGDRLLTLRESIPRISILKTLKNTAEVYDIKIELEIMINQLSLDDHPQRFEIASKIYKLSKAAKEAMAHNLTLNRDFDELHKA
jgi:hypothetical protein